MKKFGLIGKGMGLSACVAAIYGAGAAVGAVCDTGSGRAAALADQYNIASVYLDYRELLTAPEATALCVCGCDIAMVTEAVRLGKPVFWNMPSIQQGIDIQQLKLLADRRETALQLDASGNDTETMTAEISRFLQGLR